MSSRLPPASPETRYVLFIRVQTSFQQKLGCKAEDVRGRQMFDGFTTINCGEYNC